MLLILPRLGGTVAVMINAARDAGRKVYFCDTAGQVIGRICVFLIIHFYMAGGFPESRINGRAVCQVILVNIIPHQTAFTAAERFV